MHSSVNSTAQYAAVAALTGPQEHVTAMREEYRTKRQIVLDELDGCTALRLIEPQGAFYLWVRALEDDAQAFSDRAKAHELLLVPSDSFGVGGWVRVSYCVSRATIERSMPAFKALMEEYRAAR